MKNRSNIAVALLTLASLTLAGCLTDKFYKPVVTTNSAPVEIIRQTNIVTIVDNQLHTNTVTATNIVTIPVYTTNFIINPQIDSAIHTAQTVNSAVPSPVQTPITIGLSLLTGLLAIGLKIKNNQATVKDSIINAMTMGIETAGAESTKLAVANFATSNGVAAELDKHVQAVVS